MKYVEHKPIYISEMYLLRKKYVTSFTVWNVDIEVYRITNNISDFADPYGTLVIHGFFLYVELI